MARGLEKKESMGRGRLERIAEKTMQRKVAISVVIALLAVGSFYIAYQTPTGIDITKLIPNFQSNQGLTVITNNLGGSVVSPTLVVVTFPTPIVYGQDQFNQTLLKQIDAITSTISSSKGVDTVTSPTRPYGAQFNYTALGVLPPPVSAQYLIGMLSQIGKDNRTALITVGLSQSAESSQAVSDLKNVEVAVDGISLPAGATVYFGGSTQSTVDSLNLINGVLPLVLLILSLGSVLHSPRAVAFRLHAPALDLHYSLQRRIRPRPAFDRVLLPASDSSGQPRPAFRRRYDARRGHRLRHILGDQDKRGSPEREVRPRRDQDSDNQDMGHSVRPGTHTIERLRISGCQRDRLA